MIYFAHGDEVHEKVEKTKHITDSASQNSDDLAYIISAVAAVLVAFLITYLIVKTAKKSTKK